MKKDLKTPTGMFARLKEKLNSILGRKATEYGYGSMAFGYY
jgi:hypothetical protein